MYKKLAGIILILFSSYIFSLNMHQSMKKEIQQTQKLLSILSDINNILGKYPYSIIEILRILSDKKYAPLNTVFQKCIFYVSEENLSFSDAVSKIQTTEIDNKIIYFIKDISLAFELPNSEAIIGKINLINSDVLYYKDTILNAENEKIELYTKLTRLASILTIIIFI